MKDLLYPVRRRGEVIYNPVTAPKGISRSSEKKKLLRKLGLPRNYRVVGFVANFHDRKRPFVFIDMASQMLGQVGEVVFVMSGDFPKAKGVVGQRAVLELMDYLGLGEECVLLETQFPAYHLMAAMDCLVVPAINEPWGRTPVEAMLVGTPVVASASGGHRETIRHEENGLLVEPDDASAFATAVTRVLNDHEWVRDMTKRAWLEAQEKYSREKHVAAIEKIYDELMSEPGWTSRLLAKLTS